MLGLPFWVLCWACHMGVVMGLPLWVLCWACQIRAQGGRGGGEGTYSTLPVRAVRPARLPHMCTEWEGGRVGQAGQLVALPCLSVQVQCMLRGVC